MNFNSISLTKNINILSKIIQIFKFLLSNNSLPRRMFIQQGKCMGSKSHLSDPQRSETSTIVVFGTYIIAILHLCISLSLFQT